MSPDPLPPGKPKGSTTAPSITPPSPVTSPVINPVTSAIPVGTTLPADHTIYQSMAECKTCVESCDAAIRGGIIESINECVGACNQCSASVIGQIADCIKSAGTTAAKCHAKITDQIRTNVLTVDGFVNSLPAPLPPVQVRGQPAPGGPPNQPPPPMPGGGGSVVCPPDSIAVAGSDGSVTCIPPTCLPGWHYVQGNGIDPGYCLPDEPPGGNDGPPTPIECDPTGVLGCCPPGIPWQPLPGGDGQCSGGVPPTPPPPGTITPPPPPPTVDQSGCCPSPFDCNGQSWKLDRCKATYRPSQTSGMASLYAAVGTE